MSTVVRVEHLSKEYRLGVINHGMLYKDIQSWLAMKLHKLDPHSRIDADHFADSKGRFWALKDLNFEIREGERVGIIGKNGAGKSTLLRILSRITVPTEGIVKIKGRVTSLLEIGTGFHGELTGRENIYLNGAILGMKKRQISQRMDEIIDFSGIENHIDTPVKRYSSGMYVRLAFAVAAHLDGEILIADEVLAVGDVDFQKKALGKMNELSTAEGKTVIFVSHNMLAVKNICKTGMLLHKGRITKQGKIDEVIDEYNGVLNSGCTIYFEKDDFEGTIAQKITYDKLEIIQDGSLVDKVHARKACKIRIYFHINSSLLGHRQTLNVLSKEQTLLITLHDSEKFKKMDEGSYISEYTIPEKTLRQGRYILGLGSLSGAGTSPDGYLYNRRAGELNIIDDDDDLIEPQIGNVLFVDSKVTVEKK